MSIQRYNTFAIDGSQTVSKDEGGEFVYYKSHARGLAVMQARAERAEAIVALARAVERGWEACNRMQNECQTDGWTGPKLLAMEEARQVYMVATDALQAALAKAGEQ